MEKDIDNAIQRGEIYTNTISPWEINASQKTLINIKWRERVYRQSTQLVTAYQIYRKTLNCFHAHIEALSLELNKSDPKISKFKKNYNQIYTDYTALKNKVVEIALLDFLLNNDIDLDDYNSHDICFRSGRYTLSLLEEKVSPEKVNIDIKNTLLPGLKKISDLFSSSEQITQLQQIADKKTQDLMIQLKQGAGLDI